MKNNKKWNLLVFTSLLVAFSAEAANVNTIVSTVHELEDNLTSIFIALVPIGGVFVAWKYHQGDPNAQVHAKQLLGAMAIVASVAGLASLVGLS